MIYKKPPKDFNTKFEIVSCFLESNGKFVLLHRQDNKAQGDTWGVPAGKVDKEELIEKAMIREAQEETGVLLEEKDLNYFEKVYVRYPDYDFIYHIFHTELPRQPLIKIYEEEHKDFKWTLPQEALGLDLIQDLDACIKLFYKI